MMQVEEAFTDTTMEKPYGFLDFVRKRIRQLEQPGSSGETVVTSGHTWNWSHRELVFSGETFVTTGRAEVTMTAEAIATGNVWLPQNCFAWSLNHREPVFSGETVVTSGHVSAAVPIETVARRNVWLPQNWFMVQQERGNIVFLFVSHSDAMTGEPSLPVLSTHAPFTSHNALGSQPLVSIDSKNLRFLKEVVKEHFTIEANLHLIAVYLRPSTHEFLLIEVNDDTIPTGNVEPFYFAPSEDFEWPMYVADVTRDEWAKIQNKVIKLPQGWPSEPTIIFHRAEVLTQ